MRPLYDGLPVDGLDYNLATPDLGVVIITETGSGHDRARGRAPSGPVVRRRLVLDHARGRPGRRHAGVRHVSAARSPQEEADDAFSTRSRSRASSDSLDDGEADTIWLCTGANPNQCDSASEFQRVKSVNGVLVDENNRALVLTFIGGNPGDPGVNWNLEQYVYLFAVDDPRSEGDRVVVVQHSTISAEPGLRPGRTSATSRSCSATTTRPAST